MKILRKIGFALVIACCFVLTLTIKAQAATVTQAQVESRLSELQSLNGKYFTTTGGPISGSDSSTNGVQAVISSGVLYNGSSLTRWPTGNISVTHYRYKSSSNTTGVTNGTQCAGFANLAGWYLFADSGSNSASFYRLIDCQYKDINKYAKPGDIIGYYYSSSKQHSMVYISGSGNSITVIDANKDGKCKIQVRTEDISNKTDMVAISRAVNYNLPDSEKFFEIARTTGSNGHLYVLYGGRCSWNEAKTFCSRLGDDWTLATITDASEQTTILNLVNAWNGNARAGIAWIGAKYTNSNWLWDTGESLSFSNWVNSSQGSSSAAYAFIAGTCLSDSDPQYTEGKWYAASALSAKWMTGFVAEYTPSSTWTPEYYHYAMYYVTGAQGYLKAEPYQDAQNLLQFDDSNHIVYVTGAYMNKYGNIWLRVQKCLNEGLLDGATNVDGYVYSSNCAHAASLASASCTGTVVPSSEFAQGTSSQINATVNSTDSIERITATIYKYPENWQSHTEDWTVVQEWVFDDASVLGNLTTSVDLNALGINNTIDFSTLDVGYYHMSISVPERRPDSYHSADIIPFVGDMEAYSCNFDVTEAPGPKSFNRPSGSIENKITAIQNIVTDGWYWNNWSQVPEGTVQKVYYVDGDLANKQFGISNTACDSAHSSDNRYWGAWHGTKGCGFARTMFDLCWDMDTEAEAYEYRMSYKGNDTYFVDYISAGDMIYTGNQYYFVTDVNSSTITYAMVNKNGNCDVSWGNTISKTDLRSLLIQYASGDYPGYIATATPKNFASGVFVYDTYKVTASNLSFKTSRSSSSSVKTVFTLTKGESFYAATNRPCRDTDGNEWIYCRNSAGQFGWAIISGKAEHTELYIAPEEITPAWSNHTLHYQLGVEQVKESFIPISYLPEEANYIDIRVTSTSSLLSCEYSDTDKRLYIRMTEETDTDATVTIAAYNENEEISASAEIEVHVRYHNYRWRHTGRMEDGYYITELYCTLCGYIERTVYSEEYHVPTYTQIINATCGEDGMILTACEYCYEEYVLEIIPKTGDHTVVTDAAVAATCTASGKTEGSHCSVCGTILAAQTDVPALGHLPGDWEIETEPTATTPGLKVKRCVRCSEVLETEEIPPTPDMPSVPSVSTITARKGQTVTVNVYVNSNNKANQVKVTYSYDTSVLEFVEAAVTLSGMTGNGTLIVYDLNKPVDGIIGTLTFTVKDAAVDGTYTINARIADAEDAINTDGDEVPCSAAADKIKVISKRAGDLNDDGKVNLKDSMLLLQHLAGWEVSFNSVNADINGDGKINLKDSMLLLQYLAGWESEFIA